MTLFVPRAIKIKPEPPLLAPEAKLRLQAKSRLNRWIKPHPKQPHLDAPEWLVKEWKTGVRNDIADLLSHCNFQKDRNVSRIPISLKIKLDKFVP